MASFLLLHPFIVALFLLIHRKISSSWRFHSLQRVQTLLSCSFSWQGDTVLDRTYHGMVTPFLEAFSKPPPKSQPPEQLALKFVLISPARTSGPFVFQLGECPYLYLPGSFDSCVLWSGSSGGSCALMVVEGDRTEFNQAGTRWECWSKEQEPGKLWILKDWANCQLGLRKTSAGSDRPVAFTPPGWVAHSGVPCGTK